MTIEFSHPDYDSVEVIQLSRPESGHPAGTWVAAFINPDPDADLTVYTSGGTWEQVERALFEDGWRES